MAGVGEDDIALGVGGLDAVDEGLFEGVNAEVVLGGDIK